MSTYKISDTPFFSAALICAWSNLFTGVIRLFRVTSKANLMVWTFVKVVFHVCPSGLSRMCYAASCWPPTDRCWWQIGGPWVLPHHSTCIVQPPSFSCQFCAAQRWQLISILFVTDLELLKLSFHQIPTMNVITHTWTSTSLASCHCCAILAAALEWSSTCLLSISIFYSLHKHIPISEVL